jgi:queuosine precursor transporter
VRPSLRNLAKTEKPVFRPLLAGIAAMAAIVVASNILVQFLVGDWLTWGAFTYPFAFLVTDLMNRFHGPARARQVVAAGFVVGLACSFVGAQIEGPFGPLVSMRVAMASAAAFLVGQLLDIALFNRLRAGSWWKAPLVSSSLGSVLDTAIFFSLAFSATLSFIAPQVDVAWANAPVPLLGRGPVAPLWMSLAVADFSVKLAIAVLALAPFRAALGLRQGRAVQ